MLSFKYFNFYTCVWVCEGYEYMLWNYKGDHGQGNRHGEKKHNRMCDRKAQGPIDCKKGPPGDQRNGEYSGVCMERPS